MRNIKIGDNLNNQVLYFSLPQEWYSFFTKEYEEIILIETLKYQIIASSFGANYSIRFYNKETDISENIYYDMDFEGTYHPDSFLFPSDAGTVTFIDTNTSFNQYMNIEPIIKIIIDTQPYSNLSENKKIITLKTEPLLAVEDIYDELILESNNELNVKVIRKLKKGEDGNILILNDPITEIFENIDFVLFQGENYIYVEGTTFSEIYMRYLNTAKFNEVYPSKSENASLISQLSNNILLKVLEKLDGKEIVSLINLYPDAIKILSSKIAMEGYTTINKNFRIDENGTAYMKNCVIEGGILKLIDGAEVVTEKGLITNLQFVGTSRSNSKSITGEFFELGFSANDGTSSSTNKVGELIFNADIPSDFIVKEAAIRLVHAPVNYCYEDDSGVHYFWGYSRELKVYKTTDISSFYRRCAIFSEYENVENFSYEEIPNAFGANGFTASIPNDSSHQVQTVNSIDIGAFLVSGKLNRIRIASASAVPSYDGTEWYGNMKACAESTGLCMAVLNIIGYKKFKKGV